MASAWEKYKKDHTLKTERPESATDKPKEFAAGNSSAQPSLPEQTPAVKASAWSQYKQDHRKQANTQPQMAAPAVSLPLFSNPAKYHTNMMNAMRTGENFLWDMNGEQAELERLRKAAEQEEANFNSPLGATPIGDFGFTARDVYNVGSQIFGTPAKNALAEYEAKVAENDAKRLEMFLRDNNLPGYNDPIAVAMREAKSKQEQEAYEAKKAELKAAADAEQQDKLNFPNILAQIGSAGDTTSPMGNVTAAMNDLRNSPAQLAYEKHIAGELEAQNKKTQEEIRKWADEHPFWASVGSLGTSPLSGVDYLNRLVQQNAIGESLPNSTPGFSQMTQNLREGASDDLNNGWKFVYNVGMSGADSVLAGIIGGPTGGSIILGTSAAASAANDIKERGGTDEQALIGGAMSGVFEALFEKVSLGNLDAMKALPDVSKKTIFKNLLKSVITNASEEGLTELSNIMFDSWFMGGLSNYEQAVKAYMDNGVSEESARLLAKQQLRKQVGEAALSGAMMGFGFTALGSGSSYGKNVIAGKRINAGGTQQEVLDYALSFPKRTDTYQLAASLSDRGGDLTNAEIGALSRTMTLDMQNGERPNKLMPQREAETVSESGNADGQTKVETPAAAQETAPLSTTAQAFANAGDSADVAAKKAEIFDRVVAGDDTLSNSQLRKLEMNSPSTRTVFEEMTGIAVPMTNDTKTLLNTAKSAIAAANEAKTNSDIDQMVAQLEGTPAKAETVAEDPVMAMARQLDPNIDVQHTLTAEDVSNAAPRTADNAVQNTPAVAQAAPTAEVMQNVPASQNVAETAPAAQQTAKVEAPKSGYTYSGKSVVVKDDNFKKANLTKRQERIYDAMAKALGVDIRFVDKITDNDGNEANGSYKDRVITLSLNADDPSTTTVVHEAVHRIKEAAPEAYKALHDFVKNNMSDALYETNISGREALYGTTDRAELSEEVVADAFGRMMDDKALARTFAQNNRSAWDKIRDTVTDIIDTIKRALSGDGKGGKQLAQYQVDAFEDLLENLEGLRRAFDEAVRESGNAVENGAGRAYNNSTEAKRSAKEDSRSTNERGVDYERENGDDLHKRVSSPVRGEQNSGGSGTQREVKTDVSGQRLPQRRSGETSLGQDSEGRRLTEEQISLLRDTKVVDDQGRPLAVYHFTPEMDFERFEKGDTGFHFGSVDQARTRGKKKNVEHGRMFRAYLAIKNPYRVRLDLNSWRPENIAIYLCSEGVITETQWNEILSLDGSGYDSPGAKRLREILDEIGIDGFVYPNMVEGIGDSYIALRDDQIVRSDISVVDGKFSKKDSTGRELSEGQREYFKDSKVLDLNGNLKVMYRGDGEDFSVFDRKKSRYTNLYGRGFYFTGSESHAKQYGDAKPYYLDIKNPVSTTEQTITKDQLRNFLEAVAENEDDYSFENYGYGATVDSVLDSIYSGKSDFAMLYDVSQTAIGDMVAAVELFNEVNGTEYDGLILDTETVTFRSEQAKNTDNLTPTKNPDIRFSKKDSSGRDLSEGQQEYFKDSKVLDRDGNLMVLYHQTEGEFTVFDPRREGAGRRDDGTPFGIFMKSSDADIGLNGKRQMELYANITNPLVATNREDLSRQLKAMAPEYDTLIAEHAALDGEYHEKFESAKKALRDFMIEWRAQNPDASRRALYDVPRFNELYEAEDAVIEEWTEKADELSIRAKETLTQALRSAGYDGVILKTDVGSWGRSTDAYIALDPQQVKNTDNLNPTENTDIRFSKSDREADRRIAEIARLKKENARLREEMQLTHGKRTDEVGARRIAKEIRTEYGSKIQLSKFGERLIKLYDMIAEGDAIYDDIYVEAKKIAADVVDGAVELQEHEEFGEIMSKLKGRKIYFDPAMRSDLESEGGYNEIRKRNNSRFKLTSDEGDTSIDVVYEELSDDFGSLFPDDIINPADQLLRIVEVLDALSPVENNPFDGDIERATEFLAADILDRYFDAPQKHTFADKQARKLAERSAQAQQDAQRLKAEAETAHLAGQMAQGKAMAKEIAKKDEQISKLRDQKNARIAALETANQESEENAYLAGQMAQGRTMAKQLAEKDRQLSNLRSQKNARIDSLKTASAKKVKNLREDMRKDRDKRIKALKDKYTEKELNLRESRNASQFREKILRHVRDLSRKLTRPTDNQHIPERLRGPVAAMLDSINLESNYELTYGKDAKYKHVAPGAVMDAEPTKRTEAFRELRAAYEKMMEEGEYLVLDPQLMDNLEAVAEMKDIRIADMNSKQLATVWNSIRAVEKSISNANKMLARSKYQTISDLANDLLRDNGNKADRGGYKGLIGKVDGLINQDMITPDTFFHYLGKAGDEIYRMMRNAEDHQTEILREAVERTGKMIGKTDVRKLEKEQHTFKLSDGEITLTTAQIMELYALSRREQALDHIFEGGIRPVSVESERSQDSEKSIVGKVKNVLKINRPSKPFKVTLEDVATITDILSLEQRKLVEDMQEYLSNDLAAHGNETSMQVYGYRKFGEKNYWPIGVDKNQTPSDVKNEAMSKTIPGYGMGKPTKPDADNAVMLRSAFDTYTNHVQEMATYAAWLGTSESVNRLRNYIFRDGNGNTDTTMKALLEKVYGIGGKGEEVYSLGQRYLEKLLEDIASGTKDGKDTVFSTGGLTGNFKAAAIGYNIRVVAQQPTAVLRAMDMVNPKYYAKAKPSKAAWEKAKKYAPIAQWKDWGYFEINTGRNVKDIILGSDSLLEKFKQWGMYLAGLADSKTWSWLWNICEAEVKDKHPELSGEDFNKAVGERFTEIIDATQVVDSVMHRSQMMRSKKEIHKMASSFMSEPTRVFNMMMKSIYDVAGTNGEVRRKALKKVARTTASLTASFAVNAIMQSLVDALRDDDREKDYWEKFFEQMFGFTGDEETLKDYWSSFWDGNFQQNYNVVGYVPYAKDVLSILQGFDVERQDMSGVKKTITAALNMAKALNGEGKHTVQSAFITLLGEFSRLSGLGVGNLKRDIMAAVNTIANENGNLLMQYRIDSFFYKPSENTKRFYDILYKASKEDLEAYEIMYADLMNRGLTPEKIESAMKTRYKAEKGEGHKADAESYADVNAGYGLTEKGEAGHKFDVGELSNEQQKTYYDTREDVYTEIIQSDSAQKAMYRMTEQYIDDLVSRLENYANEQAKDAADPEYDIDTKWMLSAAGGEKSGVDPAEVMLFCVAYESSTGKDASGKAVTGLKKENTLKLAKEWMPWLSQRELDYLCSMYWKTEK